jgi:hypothetical protein
MTTDVATIDPSRTGPALRAIEPVGAGALLCPEVLAAFEALGLGLDDPSDRNLVARTAPIGPVGVDVAVAVTYNFNPEYLATVVPAVWERAAPAVILDAQMRAYAPVLARALAPLGDPHVDELASLARAAGDATKGSREGRPLFAGIASRPWPDEAPMVIWHAAKLLREHRGDGHIACLMVEGLDAVDALVVHAAYDGIPSALLRATRRWSEAVWDDHVDDLQRRGWLSGRTEQGEPVISDDGRARRAAIEARTDDLAASAFEPLGAAGMERMIELGAAMVDALVAAGLTYRPPAG